MKSLRQCMTSKGVSGVLTFLLVLLLLPSAAFAQVETGQIDGNGFRT